MTKAKSVRPAEITPRSWQHSPFEAYPRDESVKLSKHGLVMVHKPVLRRSKGNSCASIVFALSLISSINYLPPSDSSRGYKWQATEGIRISQGVEGLHQPSKGDLRVLQFPSSGIHFGSISCVFSILRNLRGYRSLFWLWIACLSRK